MGMTVTRKATNTSPLAKIRTDAGLSRAQLATACGVSIPTIWRWERGQRFPAGTRVGRLAKALGVKPGDLGRLIFAGAA